MEKEPVKESSSKKKDNKRNFLKNTPKWMIFAGAALVLLLIIAVYFIFFVPSYKYSFNINGVDFVSNTYTPSEFFDKFNDNNSFVVSVDVVNNASNTWVVNSMNLWLIALNADKKETILVVKNVNSNGDINDCLTNDSNTMQSRELSADECKTILSDSSKGQIYVLLSDKDAVLMEDNKLTVFASGTKTISHVNYYAISEIYPDFNTTLAKVNEKIGSVN